MRANKQKRELLRDPLAYVESIGKHDKAHTLDALADEGRDTILRVCMTTPQPVPLRALGYVAALEHIGEKYFPYAVRQLVVANGTFSRVNSGGSQMYENMETFFDELTYRPRHARAQSVMHLAHDVMSHEISSDMLEAVLRDTPENKQLQAQAERNGGDHLPYVAAHILLHDTVSTAVRYLPEHNPGRPADASRIISIGAQSERVFYNARMRFRQLNATVDDMAEATGQIFTKNVLLPYLPRKQRDGYLPYFDPLIDDMMSLRNPILDDEIALRMDSGLRDLRYVREYCDAAFASHDLSDGILQTS